MYVMCLSRGLAAIANWRNEFKPTKPIAFIPNAGDTYANPYFVGESRQRLEILGLNTSVVDLHDVRVRITDDARELRQRARDVGQLHLEPYDSS